MLPVHRYAAAKRKPLQTLRRVAEYGTRALNADPGFSGVLTRTRSPIPNYRDQTCLSRTMLFADKPMTPSPRIACRASGKAEVETPFR